MQKIQADKYHIFLCHIWNLNKRHESREELLRNRKGNSASREEDDVGNGE
jgi:hypothetical protein